MQGFSKMVPKYADVIREKKEMHILAEDIVVGDLVVLVSGESVPADVRVVESVNLKVINNKDINLSSV